MLAFGGITSALLARDRGHARGQHVQLSLLESAVALLGYHVTNYMNAGFLGERAGSGVGHIVPYQAFSCTDGFVLAGATNDELWRRFAAAIDRPELGEDPRFKTTLDRRANREALIAILTEIFAKRSVNEWVGILEAQGVPVAPVRSIDQVVHDPQVLERGMIASIVNDEGTVAHVPGIPMKLTATPGEIGSHPPVLGVHTDRILAERLGLTPDQISELRAAKAI